MPRDMKSPVKKEVKKETKKEIKPKKKEDDRSRNRKSNEQSDSDNDEFTSDDSEEEEDDDDNEMDHHEYQKLLAQIFPSKYMNKKVKAGEKLKKALEEEDEEEDDEEEEEEEKPKKGKKGETKKTTITTIDQTGGDDSDDEYDDVYLQKFNEEINKNYISDNHPECVNVNFDEIIATSKVIRDSKNNIVDDLHKTLPYLTKYEKARILGQRAKQINSGMTAFVKVPENIIDGYLIAEMELAQKRIPFIIKRPIPGGGCEYWRVSDLELIDF
jgi:DNA-directed RNA polymerase subunit K/omega